MAEGDIAYASMRGVDCPSCNRRAGRSCVKANGKGLDNHSGGPGNVVIRVHAARVRAYRRKS